MSPWLLVLACGRHETGMATAPDGGDTQPQADDSGWPEVVEGCTAEAPELSPGMCVNEAPCRWVGEQGAEYFGWSVASGGDVTGDGRQDLVIGSPYWDYHPSAAPDSGRMLVVSGAALDQEGDGVVATLWSLRPFETFGYEVAIAGDVNGDGIDDMLLNARNHADTADAQGAVYLVTGSGELADGDVEDTAAAAFLGESAFSRVGITLSRVGDLDGDGLDDVVVPGELKSSDGTEESYGAGRVYVVSGREADWPTTLADADASISGQGTSDALGKGYTGGDLDGDGYSDLAIGAPYGASYMGRVYILPGGPGTVEGALAAADVPAQLEGHGYWDVFGWELAAADMDGDGAAELAVGAPLNDDAYDSAGATYVYAGGAELVAGDADPVASILGAWDDQEFGTGVAVGDLTGDGLSDLVAGGVYAYTGMVTKSGRTWAFYGHSEGAWPTSVAEADVDISGSQVKDYLGASHALGDLDGDGRDDLVTAAGPVDVGTSGDVGSVYLFMGE